MTLNSILNNLYPLPWQLDSPNFLKEFKTPVLEGELTPKNNFHRKEFLQNLISECGEFDCLYAIPEILLFNIDNWTKTRIKYWERIWNAMCIEYNPDWNYNRYDEGDITQKNDLNAETENDSLGKIAGYDSGELVENDSRYDKQNSTENNTLKTTNNLHSYGNIGVTTTQQLLESEINFAEISLHDLIIAEFKERFLILTY